MGRNQDIMKMQTNQFDDRLEQATQARLARLANAPVDTSRLERWLEEAMTKTRPTPVARLVNCWMPMAAAVAAIVVISVTVGVLLRDPGQAPIVATPSLIASLHHEVTAGGPDAIPVTDIGQANQAIAARWSDAPTLPMPADCKIMSCCVHHVEGRKMVCMLLRYRDKLVTMVVAHAKDLTPSDGDEFIHQGQRHTVHSQDGLHMVHTQGRDTSVYLIGEFPPEELALLLSEHWAKS